MRTTKESLGVGVVVALVFLVACAEGLSRPPHWEPCKQQCLDNFTRKDQPPEGLQSLLVNVCQRGCDLFNVALISTPFGHPSAVSSEHLNKAKKQSHQEDNQIIQLKPKEKQENIPKVASQVEKTFMLGNDKDLSKSGNLLMKNTLKTFTNNLHTLIIGNASKPLQFFLGHIFADKGLKASESKVKSLVIKQKGKPSPDSSDNHILIPSSNTTTPAAAESVVTSIDEQPKSRQTTTQPADHPVQDHPAHAARQTTTNTPSADTIEKVPLKKSKVYEGNDILADAKPKEESRTSDSTIDDTHRVEQAKHSCRHACITAYSAPGEQEACVVGCHLQATSAILDAPVENAKATTPKSPLAMFQHVMFSLAGHVGRLVRVSWAWSSSSSSVREEEKHDKLQVYGSEGLTNSGHNTLFSGLGSTFQHASQRNKYPAAIIIRDEFPKTKAGVDFPSAVVGLVTPTHQANQHPPPHHHHQHQLEQQQQQQLEMHNQRQASAQQLDLLECISRKSGLPRWFIALTIFSSALVILWLCFTLTAPPDDIKVVKTKPPELTLDEDEDDDLDDDDLSCSEKKKLLSLDNVHADDIIKIRIQNV